MAKDDTIVTTILIGLGEFAISDSPGDFIKTLGLGSCVAITALHNISGTIAMAHVVLPDSKNDPVKAKSRPGYYADTAINSMFDELNKRTGGKGRYLIKLIGGAAVLSVKPANDNMNIGKRNLLATKKALWKRGLGALAEDVGGSSSRSVTLAHGEVKVQISTAGKIASVL